jgi:predicted nucleotidyltransferase
MNQRLPISSSTLADFCRRHHIVRLALFGSMQTASHRPDSDIDLLVEFASGHEPGLIALAGMELELSALLAGRQVDLRTPLDLSRYFRDEVQTAAEVQYAA